MLLKTWRFVTLLLTALGMGLLFAHILELPAKMRYDVSMWLAVQHTLYPYFAIIGAPIELGAILSAAVLSFLTRRDRRAYFLTLAATILLVVSLGVFFAVVQPVNALTAIWTPESVSPDWMRWRAQWEYGHATRFFLHLVAYSLLLLSGLKQTWTRRHSLQDSVQEPVSLEEADRR